MNRRKRRKILFLSTAGIAWILLLAASAFACTRFVGTLMVKGNAASTYVTSRGTGSTMTSEITADKAKAYASGGKIRVKTKYNSVHGNKFAQGTYEINFLNGPAYETHTRWAIDCMSGQDEIPAGFSRLGEVTINENGKTIAAKNAAGTALTRDSNGFWGDFKLPNPSKKTKVAQPEGNGGHESAVCISAPVGGALTTSQGNQAPLTVI